LDSNGKIDSTDCGDLIYARPSYDKQKIPLRLNSGRVMTLFIIKTFVAAVIISFCSWYAGKRPDIAGFIIAMPILSIIALVFSYTEYKNPQNAIVFAKSIFVGVPVSLLFFVPFLLAGKWNLSFWQSYIAGLVLLVAGYYLHKTILAHL
jgi:hypothetical protein